MNQLKGTQLAIRLGGQPILNDIDLTLSSGEMLGLVGPNGAGKSTLLKLLAGLMRADRGTILLDGQLLEALPPNRRARAIAYLAQGGGVHWPITVERVVALGRLPHLGAWQSPGEQDQLVVEQMLQRTGLQALAQRRFPTLSGGEQARVLLARALAVEPQVLLADEPVAALDLGHQLEVMTLLREHCDQGGAAVVVLHDLRLAAHYCDRLQLLYRGATLATGAVDAVLTREHLEHAYGVRIRADRGTVSDAFALTWDLGDLAP